MMRACTLTFLALLVLITPITVNAEDLPGDSTVLYAMADTLQNADKSGSALYPLLSTLKRIGNRTIKTGLPSSMVRGEVLESVEQSAAQYKAAAMAQPLPLSSKESIRSIALAGNPGTPNMVPVQLKRLKQAQTDRRAAIGQLKGEHGKLRKAVERYDEEVRTVQQIEERTRKLIDDKALSVIALLDGRSWAISVIEFSHYLVPAVMDRRDAALAASDRLDKLIIAAEADLNAYSNALAVVQWLFAEPGSALMATAPAPGAKQLLEVVRLNDELSEEVTAARAQAAEHMRRAAEIQDRRVDSEPFLALLSVTSASLGLAQAVEGGTGAKKHAEGRSPTARITYKDRQWKIDPTIWPDQGLEINKGQAGQR